MKATRLGAFGVWLLAIVGAIGMAFWLNLSLREALGLIVGVAIVAFLGAFLPVWRLHRNQKP